MMKWRERESDEYVELPDDMITASLEARVAMRDKNALARTAIKAEVTRILAKDAGTRTSTERCLLGLAWLTFREEG
jgi:hypothetical protein